MALNDDRERFVQALGEATLTLWANLPQEQQRAIFECAVRLGHHTERDESLREQLAQFLHEQHERAGVA